MERRVVRFRNEKLLRLRLEQDEGEQNRTQEALADELGVSARTYRRYETGEVNVDGFDPTGVHPRRFLKRCADFFGIGEDDLLDRSPPATPANPSIERALVQWRLQLPALLAAEATFLRAPDEVVLAVHPEGAAAPCALLALARGGGRHVVLGDAGAGKSTAIRQVVAALARDGRAPVPVWLQLPRLTGEPLFAEAAQALGVALAPEARQAAAAALAEAAAMGRVVVLLDAFDEVSPAHEAECLRAVRFWAETWPKATWVVFSRPAADPTEALGFARVRLCPLDETQRQHVLTGRLESPDRARRLLRQAEAAGLGVLLGNPLMLGLLALLEGEPGIVDAGRLLSRALEVLLVRGAPGVGRGVQEPVGARHLLRRLALALHGAPGEAWTREALASILMEAMEADLQGQLHLRMAWGGVTGFLEDVARNGAVLGPLDGPDRPWRFLHRALREALVAEALAVDGRAAARARRLLADAERDGLRTQISRWRPVLDLLVEEETRSA